MAASQEKRQNPSTDKLKETLRDKSLNLLTQAKKHIGVASFFSTDYFNHNAAHKLQFGDCDKAFQTLQIVRKPNEETFELYSELAEFYEDLGDRKKALAITQAAFNVAGDIEGDRDIPNKADISFGIVSKMFAKLGDANGAMTSLDAIRDAHYSKQRNDHDIYPVVYFLAKAGNEQGAQRLVALLSNDQSRAFGMGKIAEAYASNGDFESMGHVLNSIEVPTHAATSALIAAARNYLKQGVGDKARAMIHFANESIPINDDEMIYAAWQHHIVEFALKELMDPNLAREIADHMAPEFWKVKAYTSIAKRFHEQGNSAYALDIVQAAQETAKQVIEKRKEGRRKAFIASVVAGTKVQMGFKEEKDYPTQDILEDIDSISDIIDFQLREGNTKYALHLINSLPDEEKGKWLIRYGERLAENRQIVRAIKYLDAGAALMPVFEIQESSEDDYVHEAREMQYSYLGRLTIAYAKAGDTKSSHGALQKLFDTIYSTRNHEDKNWYDNVMRNVAAYATEAGDLNIALRAAEEITRPLSKCDVFTGIAVEMVNRGDIDGAFSQLTNAEMEAEKVVNTEKMYASGSYISIEGVYYLIGKISG